MPSKLSMKIETDDLSQEIISISIVSSKIIPVLAILTKAKTLTGLIEYFQMLICSECMMCIHKLPDHKCDRVSDLETKQIEDLKVLMEDTKSKIDTCRDTSGNLESLLSDLQQQRDAAQDLIKETFQSYKAILEKRKVFSTVLLTRFIFWPRLCTNI